VRLVATASNRFGADRVPTCASRPARHAFTAATALTVLEVSCRPPLLDAMVSLAGGVEFAPR
jgi:hypothetical protein